jgi:hypothetical protein
MQNFIELKILVRESADGRESGDGYCCSHFHFILTPIAFYLNEI